MKDLASKISNSRNVEHWHDYITAVHGVMICIMIFPIHCNYFSHFYPAMILQLNCVLSFFMPWFFYKSGFFSKTSWGGRHYLKKYICPFAIYGLIGWLVQGLILCLGEGESVHVWLRLLLKGFLLRGNVYGNGALWFLLTLFFVRLFSDSILHKVHPLVVALVCLSVATAHFYFADSHTPWYLGNFFSGLCFFSLGNYFRKHEQNKCIIVVAAVVYFSFVMLYLAGKMDYAYFYFHKNTISKGSYLLFYPVALSGIIVTNNLFRRVYDYWEFPLLSYVGRNAMNFYVTHWIVLVVAQFVFSYQLKIQSPKYLCLLYALSCIVVLPIISYLINLIKNRKYVQPVFIRG